MQKNTEQHKSSNLDFDLEQLSAAIDNEDILPKNLLNNNAHTHQTLKNFWHTTHIVQAELQKTKPQLNIQQNTSSIMQALVSEPIFNQKKQARNMQIKHTQTNTIDKFKKWLGLSLPVGITALFMALSIGTHNMHAFKHLQSSNATESLLAENNMHDNSNAYFNLHQKSDVRAYGLMNIANNDDNDDNDDDYIEVAYSQPYVR
jgi:negative regulator of sigma E activity